MTAAFYTMAFSLGGANNGGYQLFPGDIIWCTSHTSNALVIDVNTTSGLWSSGTAAGTITMQVIYGTWTANQYFDADSAGSNTGYIVSLTSLSKPTMAPGLLSTPTISHANYGRFLASIKVKRATTDKMYTATLNFDQLTVTGQYSLIYWQKLMVWIPDYSGTYNLVFMGIAPSSNTDYQAYGGDEALTAYSYDWYLSKQFLEPLFVNMPWQAGVQTMNPNEYFKGCIAFNLGFSGTAWSAVGVWLPYLTGIYPALLNNPTGWGTTLPATSFAFTAKTTKQAAFDKICEYTSQLFLCKWNFIVGPPTGFIPLAYLNDYANIDTGFGLPNPLYLTHGVNIADDPTNGNPYLLTAVPLSQKGEDVYNFFTVRGQYPSGAWFQEQTFVAGVYDSILNPSGTVIKLPYYEENKAISTPADALARAVAISNYYQFQTSTWICKFRQRSDLVLYQRVIVSGFGNKIPNDTYRIISIDYEYSASGHEITNEVTVTLISNSLFIAYLGTMRIFVNPVQEIENITKNLINMQNAPVPGTILTISQWQPIITFTANGVQNYVVTMAILGSAPAFSVGATATITGISGSGQSWTITFTIGGTTYTGNCAAGGSLSLGMTGKVTAINAQVTFNMSDLGSGQSYVQTGYTSNASSMTAGDSVTAVPDQNGKYVVTNV